MIELSIHDDIARVTLNAPERLNALGPDDLRALDAAYAEAESAGVRALILRGEGRSFCAGRNIAGVDPATDDVAAYLDGLVTPLLKRMSAFPAPTFAAARGAAVGVGLGLLVATDVVYVADDAKFGSPFAALGAALDSGGHWLLVSRLGSHRALDLIYSARLIPGAEAVAGGLFSRALPADRVEAEVEAAARAAAAGATRAFLASKRIVAGIRDGELDLWSSVDAENAAQEALSSTADYREGFAAFQQKRPPVFRGE